MDLDKGIDSTMIEFSYLSKNEFNKYASKLFSVLYDNMTEIAPTGNSREEDYKSWYKAMCGEMQSDKRHIIVISNENMKEIIGFFRYSINEYVFVMEDIQIKDCYRGKYNIFRTLYGFVLEHINEDIHFVEAYANKINKKSLGILEKLGLSIIGENKNGISYHLRGSYADLLKWYKKESV